MFKKKRKRIKALSSRPKPSDFDKSRYILRDGIIWMKSRDKQVYAIFNGYWNCAKRELRRLRTLEWKQNSKVK